MFQLPTQVSLNTDWAVNQPRGITSIYWYKGMHYACAECLLHVKSLTCLHTHFCRQHCSVSARRLPLSHNQLHQLQLIHVWLFRFVQSQHFCRAMLCKRGLCRHAVCLSVRLSVTLVNSVKTSNHIFKFFFTVA